MGVSYGVDLQECTLRGVSFVRLRNKVARAARTGLTVVEAGLDQWADAVAAVDRVRLASKGEGPRCRSSSSVRAVTPRRPTAGCSSA
ncbi:hypothetical protein [Streptomyces buecherae]|uniref:hypothetical protein n=1 Tax=Streptomyces buecherae TaxID=2763006 RepID=UPI0022B7A98A|nr:hypothetical protein [Streptomyces buecherae]